MRLQILVLLFAGYFLIFSNKALGQGLCDKGGGNFELNVYEGCLPLSVTITNKVPNPILVGYNPTYDGLALQPGFFDVPTASYSGPGTFTMIQQVATSAGVYYACKQVKVYETRGVTSIYTSCGGGNIKMSFIDDAILRAYDTVEIKWGDGETQIWKNGDPINFEHNYKNTAITPTIILTGYYEGGKACSKGRESPTPVSFQQVQLSNISIKTLEMRGDGILRLNYEGVVGITTSINYSTNGNTFVAAGSRTSGGVQPFDIKNLSTTQVYQLKLLSTDLCSGKLESDIVGSMVLSGKSQSGKNVLTWNQYINANGFQGYDLLRDGTVIKSFTSVTETSYSDEDVQCGTFSEYQLVAKWKGITSTSAPLGIKAEIFAAQPIEKAYVTVTGDKTVTISAMIPGAGSNSTYDMTIEKAESGTTTYKKLITLYNSSEYLDQDVKANETSYCYRISYQNSCGQKVAATEPICTILLKNNLSSFIWTTEKPFLNAVASYDVLQKGSSGSSQEIGKELNNIFMPILGKQSDLQYSFQIRANSSANTFQSFSNIVDYKRNAGVFVPDAFSPNGDGLNDELLAKSAQLQSFSFSVLNRWGETIFHSNDITIGWDGNIKGINAPVGSYIYKVSFVDDINQKVDKSGTFILLR